MILKSDLCIDEKSALLFVVEPEEDKVHISWEVDGQIISFERIPINYPSSSLMITENFNQYLDTIREVDWINENNVVKIDKRFDFKNALKKENNIVNK